MPNPRIIAITGASGFVGRAVVHHLRARHYTVRAFTHSSPPADCEDSAQCTWRRVDCTDHAGLRAATEGVDMLVHLAARKNDERDSEAVNVGGARVVADVCAENGIQRIIHLSTQSTHLRKRGAYGETKKRADEILRAGPVPVVTLCSSLIYGSAESGVFSVLSALSRLPVCPVVGSGTACYWPIHRDDVAIIIEKCLLAPMDVCRHWEMGGSEWYTYDQLCEILAEAAGRIPRRIHLPIPLCLLIAWVSRGLPKPPLTMSNVRGAAERVIMDPIPLLQALDVAPRSLRSVLLPQHESITAYADALLSYVLSDCSVSEPTDEEVKRMVNALAVHTLDTNIEPAWVWRSPRRLRSIDFASRIREPGCHLQRALIVAAAVAECSPRSSSALLPRSFTVAAWSAALCRTLFRLVRTLPGAMYWYCHPKNLTRVTNGR